MKIKVGDKVRVITGASKGKEGKVVKTFKDENKLVVEGINMIKKHMKPSSANEKGGIVEREAKIDASNVMLIDPKTNKTTRIGHKIEKKGKKEIKVRTSKRSNETLD